VFSSRLMHGFGGWANAPTTRTCVLEVFVDESPEDTVGEVPSSLDLDPEALAMSLPCVTSAESWN